jgi:hypothetical protein
MRKENLRFGDRLLLRPVGESQARAGRGGARDPSGAHGFLEDPLPPSTLTVVTVSARAPSPASRTTAASDGKGRRSIERSASRAGATVGVALIMPDSKPGARILVPASARSLIHI